MTVKCRNCKHNTLHEEDGEQYSWCEIDHDNYDIDEPMECISFKTATNAQKIRAMSDEELAKWIARQTTEGGRNVKESERLFWLDWLKSSAETKHES